MKAYARLLALGCFVVAAGIAHAEPGAVFVEGHGGGMIPLGNFHKTQEPGGTYSVAVGYEAVDFLDLLLEFTHSFNDIDDVRIDRPGFTVFADETAQTFVLGIGPRINFLPSDVPVRPYGLAQVGWYHFDTMNDIFVDGERVRGDDGHDAVGFAGGLGLQATIFQLFERRSDQNPLMELTIGAEARYHQALDPARRDKQFLTAVGSIGVRF